MRRRAVLRRRLFLATGLALVVVAVLALVHPVDHAVQEIKLPLRHEDIIRQQAADKGVDASLIAAVIYTESHFRDQTSHAGATGLMQLLPSTADYIARKSGGTRFTRSDLATPQINIAYGTWYLRYLLAKYHGNVVLTLAAYNAGEGKVDQWWQAAQARGEHFDVARHIPFAETRDYVHRVLSARREYRRNYAHELGLN
jgi:soluble lytic murein transglycosylase